MIEGESPEEFKAAVLAWLKENKGIDPERVISITKAKDSPKGKTKVIIKLR